MPNKEPGYSKTLSPTLRMWAKQPIPIPPLQGEQGHRHMGQGTEATQRLTCRPCPGWSAKAKPPRAAPWSTVQPRTSLGQSGPRVLTPARDRCMEEAPLLPSKIPASPALILSKGPDSPCDDAMGAGRAGRSPGLYGPCKGNGYRAAGTEGGHGEAPVSQAPPSSNGIRNGGAVKVAHLKLACRSQTQEQSCYK